MIGKIKLCSNIEEKERCEKLGMEFIPKYIAKEFLFKIDNVIIAHLTVDNDIMVCIDDEWFLICFDSEIWESIKQKLQ